MAVHSIFEDDHQKVIILTQRNITKKRTKTNKFNLKKLFV